MNFTVRNNKSGIKKEPKKKKAPKHNDHTKSPKSNPIKTPQSLFLSHSCFLREPQDVFKP